MTVTSLRPEPETPTKSAMRIASPIGTMVLEANDWALTNLHLPNAAADVDPDALARGPLGPEAAWVLDRAAGQLDDYFSGRRRTFSLPLDPVGTEFQRSVWWALADIEFGSAISYGELALRLGRTKGFRAVGQANGRNPIAIILPCHRVLAAKGQLGGYGGGLDVKRMLLDHEQVAYSG